MFNSVIIKSFSYIFFLLDYLDIIKVLRSKIAETDDLITIKKNAKAEFSYSLSRNLLKTISNLSMEVISLN